MAVSGPRLVVAIETSNPAAHGGASSAAVARWEGIRVEVVAEEVIAPATRADDDLAPAIDRAMRRARIAPREVEVVAVSVGPGGYTAVRMGVACAVMIARGAGAEVRAVPTALAGALGASDRVAPGTVLEVCLAWKGDTVWRHRFEAGPIPRALDAGALVRVDQVGAGGAVVVAGQDVAPGLPDRVRPVVVPIVLSGALVARCAPVVDASDPVGVAPIYPREPEAVTKWAALRAKRADR